MPRAKLQGSQLKKFRSDVAKLKRLGLVSKKVDARTQKSTSYMRNLVEKKFADVLSGRAVAVKVPTRKKAKEFAEGFTVKGKTVIVPKEKGASKPFYSKKTGEIKGKFEVRGKTFSRSYSAFAKGDDFKFPKLKKNQAYWVPLGNGFQRFDSEADLIAFMVQYEKPRTVTGHNPYKDWKKYVFIDTLDSDGADE